MSAGLELLGRVAAGVVTRTLDVGKDDAGFARFLMSALSNDEVVAIAAAVWNDPALRARVEIRLPSYRFAGLPGVEPDMLTDLAETVLRHLPCDREGRLMALTDESQRQSLSQVVRIDADALLDERLVPNWIREAGVDPDLGEDAIRELQAALRAVLAIDRASLRHFASYVAAVADQLTSQPVSTALGISLPALRVPRFDRLLADLQPNRRQQPSQVRQKLQAHWRRVSYFAKRDLKQLPFTSTTLREKLEQLRDGMRDEVYDALSDYIDAPDGASEVTIKPFGFDWPEIQSFFEEAQRTEKDSIGEKTVAFYAQRDPTLLTAEERTYVEDLPKRGKKPTKDDTDEAFFVAHARELREEPRLAALWERFIYGQRVDCGDLLDGLVQCLRRIYQPEAGRRRVLVVEALEASPASFVQLNDEACRFFATRYRGLASALSGVVDFRKMEAFRYPEFADEIARFARRTADAKNKRARQLNFRVWMETTDGTETEQSADVRLTWECELGAVGIELEGDLRRLRENKRGTPLVACVGGRRTPAGRARGGGIDLIDLSGLEPNGNRDRGAFVPASKRCVSLATDWKAGLKQVADEKLITLPARVSLQELFSDFEVSYREAVSNVVVEGWASPSVGVQAEAFGALLEFIVREVTAPVAVERLLRPLLEIGSAPIETSERSGAAILMCPWQPLRMAAIATRWRRLNAQLLPLLSADPTTFTDSGNLFFAELRRELGEPLRPDVATTWVGEKAEPLSFSSEYNDYSLHEVPVAIDGRAATTNDNVRVEARQIVEIVESYLRLQPHERDNLSVVLYNCDSAALPQAVVDGIGEAERDGEAMCQVMLTHTNEERLRGLYQQLVTREIGEDGLYASETTRDFMSRLRISIMVAHGPTASSRDGPPYDIVFCRDVIARQARPVWADVAPIERAADEIDSGEWSRRIPLKPGERDAVVLLACPAQPREGWAYLDALSAIDDLQQTRLARGNGRHRVLARQTDVLSPETRRVLEETHRLGAWVVNIDDLLDRRQLESRDVKVIRYRKGVAGGRNLIISSSASDALLRATLRNRLASLDPEYDADARSLIAARLVDEANRVSGDLVLRAAKRASNANELIGVVLSKFLVDAELGHDRQSAWVFLDDYAGWLGQDEKRIADLLCLAPTFDGEGRPMLDVIVTEAKFVAAASMNAKAADSSRQLRDTLARLESAMSPESAPADRRIWRARLAEMLMDGLRGTPSEAIAGVDWRLVLRSEECRVRVRGYSHVFGHAAPGEVPSAVDAYVGVQHTSGEQERYAPDSVRAIIHAFASESDPTPVRERVRGGTPGGDLDGDPRHGGGDGPPTSGPRGPRNQPAGAETGGEAALPERGETVAVTAASAGSPEVSPSSGRPFRDLIETYASAQVVVEDDEAWLKDVSGRCRNALLRYGMSARLEDAVLTPNSALLRFKGADDLTVAKVEARLEELETTHGLQVLSVRALPGQVAISIRRPVRTLLTLPGVWRTWTPSADGANTRLLIAIREDDGEPLYLEPEPAPHTLVAGSTGSGKSVLMQNIILGIAATNTPAQAKVVLIDPKAGVDYFAFDALPHLDGGIVDQPEAALERLDGLVQEMERRYALFRAARATNIRAYNRGSDEPLPAIWVIHDEFADWMQIDSYRQGVEATVSRLGVKARAAGIYLIFAAQRPDNTVFPMQLRSNLGNRLVLRVDSAGTSDLSLGLKGGGAERLLGQGHLAAVLGGGTSPQYAQVPFIDEAQLSELVAALAEQYASGCGA